MPKLAKLPGPMMRTRTGLNPDQARLQICKKPQDFGSLQPPSHRVLASAITAVSLEDALCNIETDRRSVHLGRSPLVEWSVHHFHSGTLDAVKKGSVHFINSGENACERVELEPASSGDWCCERARKHLAPGRFDQSPFGLIVGPYQERIAGRCSGNVPGAIFLKHQQ
jgi:hypothetical protein